jgi:carbon-monoxide dehydrogenase catalytic subunit
MGLETIFDRYEAQQPQCGFGMAGVCCQLCSHGPCRITGKTSRGICGATADTIVARNLVRLAARGAAAYTHHLEELADTIKATVRGKTPFTTGDPEKLREIAAAAGLDTAKETGRLAEELAGMMLAELRKSSRDPLALVKLFAPKTRVPKMVLLEVMRT